MSKENVKKFYELLQQDSATVEELKKAGENVDSAEKAMAVLIEFAASKNFDFNREDIAEFEAETQKELTPEELDQINAGAWGACLFWLGIGWGESNGVGTVNCKVVGTGPGIGWQDAPAQAPKQKTQEKTKPLTPPLLVPQRFDD